MNSRVLIKRNPLLLETLDILHLLLLLFVLSGCEIFSLVCFPLLLLKCCCCFFSFLFVAVQVLKVYPF